MSTKNILKIKEKQFQQAVIELAELRGFRVYHVSNVRGKLRSDTSVGFPDLVMTNGKVLIFAELKVGGNEPTAHQDKWLKLLRMIMVITRNVVQVYVWKPENWNEIELLLTR